MRRLLDDADWNAGLEAELAENRATGEYPDADVAGRWARSRGSERLVIVAGADSDAERLYARAGFVPGEPGFGAYSAAWPPR